MKNYNDAKQALYDHVGFKEDWVFYPIDDCTEYYWTINWSTSSPEGYSVSYADTIENLREGGDDNYWVDDIYTQRFYKKWVYRGERYTMIFCNPGVDGMKYFRIFDNEKED